MKKKISTTLQQGDVLLRKLTSMPEGEQRTVSTKRLVVAHGESGHSHVIEDDEAELIQIGERILLRLARPAIITHEEHRELKLAPGIWEVGRVKEYDYFERMERQVRD